MTTQKAINVSAHNIANVNTDGYSRQSTVLSASEVATFGGIAFGTGVKITDVERVYDSLLNVQLRDAESIFSKLDTEAEILSRLEGILNDLDGAGLNDPLNDFFNTIQDVSLNPASYPERVTMISSGTVLAERINLLDSRIRQNFGNVNVEVEETVSEINSLSERVAEINHQISVLGVAGVSANDLLDQRDRILSEIGNYLDITTAEDDLGKVDVFVGGGFFLVSGVETVELETKLASDNSNAVQVVSGGVVIDDKMTGGTLKGLVNGRDHLLETKDKLDRLAASLSIEFNIVHRAGIGLDSSTNVDFFKIPNVDTVSLNTNTGGAVIAPGSISDLTQLTLDEYEVRFYSPSQYNIINLSDRTITSTGVYTSGSNITFDGITIAITDLVGTPQSGDTFTVSITDNAGQAFGVSIDDPSKIAAATDALALPGDNRNALLLMDLNNAPTIDGTSYSDYYQGIAADVGITTAEVITNRNAQEVVVAQVEQGVQAISGVSLEEEATKLLSLQRAFEAAARVIKTADEMYEILVNL